MIPMATAWPRACSIIRYYSDCFLEKYVPKRSASLWRCWPTAEAYLLTFRPRASRSLCSISRRAFGDRRGEWRSEQHADYGAFESRASIEPRQSERAPGRTHGTRYLSRRPRSCQKNLEDWFNSFDGPRVWLYKRSTQWIVLVIALVVTVVFNVDTLGARGLPLS